LSSVFLLKQGVIIYWANTIRFLSIDPDRG
jgi:hypothetical protein